MATNEADFSFFKDSTFFVEAWSFASRIRKYEAMVCCSSLHGVRKPCFTNKGILTESKPPEFVLFLDHSSILKKNSR